MLDHLCFNVRFHSKYMDHEEIEGILRLQWKPLHMGAPYVEDYYYQAFVYKYFQRGNKCADT